MSPDQSGLLTLFICMSAGIGFFVMIGLAVSDKFPSETESAQEIEVDHGRHFNSELHLIETNLSLNPR